MIKLFVSDLDGTLLNRMHRSDEIIDATIDEVLAQGKKFAIATGRHLHKNHRVGLTFLDRSLYVICMNGALVCTPTGEVLSKQVIDQTLIQEMLERFPEVSFELVTQEAVLVQRGRWAHYRNITRHTRSLRHIAKHLIAACVGDYQYCATNLANEAVLKVDCRIAHEATRKKFRAFLAEKEAWLVDAGYHDEIFEITAATANKRNAVQVLLRHLSLEEDQVAVYGNDRNDVEMLAHFVHSYAPNNSADVALEAANYQLESSYAHSVAHHIRKMATHKE
ncbi:Cof-type HAD-IIB family hydrolase [Aerococcaceae bacterium NML190938]|nr:Cof-type HAD-IIB family hydrolase [Aerococcaceae bacterium NML190938]